MYDELRAINISHKKFDRYHNGLTFQTKDLDCDLSEYCVFNGQLYQESDNIRGSGRNVHNEAKKIDYTGELNVYARVEENDVESWVEYDLIFNHGKLTDVVPCEVSITKDNRDLSSFRPAKPSNRVEVTINLSNCEQAKQDTFIESLTDEKTGAIRNILEEPTATIFYPITVMENPFAGRGACRFSQIRYIASVVQVIDDFGEKITAPNGDKITIVLDEFSQFS